MVEGVKDGKICDEFNPKVPTAKLLKTLRKNRETHQHNYEEAVQKFVNQSIEALRTRLKSLINGDVLKDLKEVLKFDLPVPVSYKDAYDEVIKMLEFSEQKEIEISGDQYRAWVEDQWDWSYAFAASTMSYAAPTAGNPVGASL